MRKLLLPLLAIVLFITCKKHDPEAKIQVCHHDQKEGTSHTITISAKELPVHLAHGDLPGACPIVTTNICDQTWMVKNLDVDHYRNGDPIPQVTDAAAWATATTGAWCYYNNDPANGAIYGKLYNGYAVNDPRGLAPEGWHIPTNSEWETLTACLGGQPLAGGKLKEIGTTHWIEPNIEATNETGFTALPGGLRIDNGGFVELRVTGEFWSTTKTDQFAIPNINIIRYLQNYNGYLLFSGTTDNFGNSVRCVKD